MTKYYFVGASRIAMKTGSTLTYLLGDHLGSTSLTADATGNFVSELRYKPWGETRYSSGTTATSYRYTGQREEVSFGLYFYNARWYDPALGRFAQADTIVPGGVQGYDRYAYTNNNPLRYTDPTGHESVCGQANSDPECGNLGNGPLSHPKPPKPQEPQKPEKEKGDGQCGQGGAYNCPPAPKLTPSNIPSPTNIPDLPQTTTLHPLDGNVVSEEIIYDYSYSPPRPIGKRITSYAYDDYHVDVGGFLFPDFSDPVSGVEFAYQLAGDLLKPSVGNLATVGVVVTCPECGVVITAAFSIYEVNENITFDAHLRTHEIYFDEPLLQMPFQDIQGIKITQ